MQKNWIGKSKGAEVLFQIDGTKDKADRFYHASRYAVRRHLYGRFAGTSGFAAHRTEEQKQAVADYQAQAASKSDLERAD